MFSRSKTDGWYPHAYRCDGIGTEIPKDILDGLMSKIFSVSCNTSTGKRMVQINFPRQMEGLIF